jgi:DNA-binding MarR family transcriptional regulator
MTNFTGTITGKGRTPGAALRPRKLSDTVTQKTVANVLDEWHSAWPELDLGPLGLFAALAQVYWLTAPEIERLMAAHGITRGMFDLLTTLRRAGPPYTLGPKELGRSLLLSGAGITNRLDRLEARKLIQRLPDPSDRRGLRIELTPAGLKLVDRIVPQLIRLERSMAAGLTEKKAVTLLHLLDEFAQRLSQPQKLLR